MRMLGVREPDLEPHATQHIDAIVDMIAELIASGHAYATEDGVYYAVKSFPRYGALAHRDVDELLVGARIAENEHKHDPLDFALWKFAKPGEPRMAVALGPRPAGLAHRVQRDVARAARGSVRHSRRRHGSDFPAPRKRNRAERTADAAAPAHGQPLGARRDAELRREEDVEVARQLRTADRAARTSRSARDPAAVFADRLSQTDELHRGLDRRRQQRGAEAAQGLRCVEGASGRRLGRRCASGFSKRSTTT